MENRIKLLMLGTHDLFLAGHVAYTYNEIPNELFDKKMIVLESCKKKESYAFRFSKSISTKIRKRLYPKWLFLKRWIKYRTIVDKEKSEYCFYSFDDECISAEKILKKCGGFIPDVISIHWVARFVSSKTIKDLYEKTKAHIVITFVDEAPLSGGCHYHCDCNQYLYECERCPVLKSGMELARIQMVRKMENLRGIPLTIVGSPYDMEKASFSSLYKDANKVNIVAYPQVTITSREQARRIFKIDEKDFVILIGASRLKDKRKGLEYAIHAVEEFSKDKKDISVLLLGNDSLDISFISNIEVVQPGYLDNDKMCAAFCASDVFLSSTIADSGPMMVNYSCALGVPVVSFDLGIAHTLVKHKGNGYLAEYKNIESLKNGLNFVYGLSLEEKKNIKDELITMMSQYKQQKKWYEIVHENVKEKSFL